MGCWVFYMTTRDFLDFLWIPKRGRLGFVFRVVFGLWFCFSMLKPVAGLRPIRERARSWGDEWLFVRKDESEFGPFHAWNITGTYRGNWKFMESMNSSSKFPDFRKSAGDSVIELVSTPTKITGVHYVQGAIIFHDVFDNKHNVGGAQIRVEGVYIWPFRQLRMVANSGKEGELSQEEDYILSNPYHLLGVFSSQVFQDSPRDKIWRRKISPIYKMEKHCNIEIDAQISRISSSQNDGDHDRYHIEGLMESPTVDDDGDCFSPLLLNATSVNIEVYYNKAVNYTLMVTFVSFLQVLLLIRQMEHSNTQSGAAKVSILTIGQQAIMDAYLCLLHLTSGILVESLFNAFATAAFFKFVVFSIFEMRYLLVIWKASRPMNNGEGWETMRRELSVLYSRFYGILLGGILFMYEFHNFLRPIILLLYSFWIPQIIANVIRDSRKPLHPHYILGMTITRLAIPLYIFGCPHNFMRIEPDKIWCICLGVFIGLQASILLLQHYLGSRWFIPRQILPEKYSYYRRFDTETNHTTDCVICMASIDLTQRSRDCMVTPCDHFFHCGCLQRWMDIKMECPTCRRSLPTA
ncbi:RING/U-box superfamily protein isoform 2 [Hibiscus syriacus]|uniref:RING-type E3 ubiquitin transferase n=1 Tax=Hibiscus syriacus TaxID=106335 RepID=A0A6A2XZR2_HIBSY|nr:transmembrane E3 ubiquitin-protein ligase FLY2-like [Hibiscus syriacus]XP_039034964.1 transmembrane E3 ubiquitin-protein ligase FLY2-like [Hibiscus syriacus]KAE8673015.1 RING/U-box superfamily protein isoform 2 [Hibiscus syriacus]